MRHLRLLWIMAAVGMLGVDMLVSDVLVAGGDEGPIQLLPAGEPDPLDDERKRSLQEITAQEVCEFHAALLRKCMEKLPRGTERHLSYGGVVATHDGDNRVYDENCELMSYRGGQWVHGSIGEPLTWTLFGDEPTALLGIWLSLQKTEQTVCEWKSSNRTLYVNVSSMLAEWKSVDEARKELGDLSVKNFLRLTNLPVEDEADKPQ